MEQAMDRFEITDRCSNVVGDQPSAEPDQKLAVMPVQKERKILEVPSQYSEASNLQYATAR